MENLNRPNIPLPDKFIVKLEELKALLAANENNAPIVFDAMIKS